jgi:hypothetical protein
MAQAQEGPAAPAGPAGEPRPQPKPTGADGVRLWQYVRGDTPEFFNYGLKVVPPWTDGGHLLINFPEHLEYNPGTRGILRYGDKDAKGHWVVAADGMSAALDAESVTAPGVFVEGRAKAVSRTRIEVTLKIINRTERLTLGAVTPLYCHQYRTLAGFPQWQGNFDHTLVLRDGKLTPLSAVKTEKEESDVKAGSVKGCPQKENNPFVTKRGGLIEDGVDASIAVVTSLDGKRALVLGWTPGRNAFSNRAIPCVHADPWYGDIGPGESREAKEVIILTEDDPAKVVRELQAEAVGRPANK